MLSEVRRLALFAVYQVAVALGILLMPVALVAGKAGVALPVDRVVDALGRAYDDASGRARPR
jgi:hypothetical protein